MRKSATTNVTRELTTETICENIISNAKDIAGKRVAAIPLSLIDICYKYQRPIIRDTVKKIKENWNPIYAGYLVVSYRDGKFWVIDGQNRFTSAIELGLKEIGCIIITGLTFEEEAHMFTILNTNQRKARPIDTYKANLACGNRNYPEVNVDMDIDELLKKYKIELNPSNLIQMGRRTRSVTALRRIYVTSGKEGLNKVFKTITDSAWAEDGVAYTDDIMTTISVLYNSGMDEAKLHTVMENYSTAEIINKANNSKLEHGSGRNVALTNTFRTLAK